MRRLTLLVVAAFVIAAVAPAMAFAQTYPPPIGSVQLTPTTGAAGPGEDVPVVCRATGTNGGPLQGATCTMTITSEPGGPGGDASIGSKVHTATTDASGNATFNLYTGSKPGIITLTVKVGALESQVNIIVQGTTQGSGVGFVQPNAPASAGQQAGTGAILPPNTGDGGLASTNAQNRASIGILTVSFFATLALASLAGLRRPR